jgi:DNA-binding transcriptional LysR family regulator
MTSFDWNDLRHAIAVAEHKTLTAAARRLRVSQPTVGRRIAALERTLGVALFLRSARGWIPTAAGIRLVESASILARDLDSLERGAIDDQSALRGLVRIAVTEITAGHLLERALPRLRREHPEILCALKTSNAAADLARGEADVAVRLVKPEGAELAARKLGMLAYALYASEGYLAARGAPRTLASLEGHDVVAPDGELLAGPEARWLGPSLRGASASLRAHSMPALAAAAAAGMGLVVLPTTIGHDHPGLRPVAAVRDLPARPVFLVVHRDARRVARIRAMADAIAADLEPRIARGARAAR